MALYVCKQSGCRGHHNFSETCAGKVVLEYPVLSKFQEMLDLQALPDDQPTTVTARPSRAKAYLDYWQEK